MPLVSQSQIAAAIRTLPLALSPVSQIVKPLWPRSSDRSSELTDPAWNVMLEAIWMRYPRQEIGQLATRSEGVILAISGTINYTLIATQKIYCNNLNFN
jgi:hypothetical protein